MFSTRPWCVESDLEGVVVVVVVTEGGGNCKVNFT
jgi:hypothetical protein